MERNVFWNFFRGGPKAYLKFRKRIKLFLSALEYFLRHGSRKMSFYTLTFITWIDH